MNNPFERDRNPSATAINNPFDTNPSSARNRFPDISQSASSPMYQPETSPWTQQPDYYNQLGSQQQLQQHLYPSFTSNASSQFASPPRSPLQFGSAPTGSFQTSPSMYGASGFAAGVASGGSYTSPMTNPGPGGYSQYNPASTPMGNAGIPGYGLGSRSLGASPYMTDAGRSLPQNISVHPQLSQFDPLSPSSTPGGAQASFGQPAYQQGYPGSNATGQFQESDPGPLIWHPRNPGAGAQAVTGFNGQTTVHVHMRPHNYTANDHPRNVIAAHRVELEQWDQYGWRQALNSLESLRIAWEHLRDDVSRLVEIGAGPQEKAVYRKMRQETTEKIDNITAAYLQMQEVFSSYRQSPDPSSKKRVRDCLNAGLRSLPDWP